MSSCLSAATDPLWVRLSASPRSPNLPVVYLRYIYIYIYIYICILAFNLTTERVTCWCSFKQFHTTNTYVIEGYIFILYVHFLAPPRQKKTLFGNSDWPMALVNQSEDRYWMSLHSSKYLSTPHAPNFNVDKEARWRLQEGAFFSFHRNLLTVNRMQINIEVGGKGLCACGSGLCIQVCGCTPQSEDMQTWRGAFFFGGVEPTPYLVLQNLLFSIKGGSHVQTTNDLDPARQKDFQNISPPRSGDLWVLDFSDFSPTPPELKIRSLKSRQPWTWILPAGKLQKHKDV